MQTLGEKLTDLTDDELRNIGLDEALLDAVVAAKKMRSRGALRRQRQLIGKLMRKVDADSIRRALESRQRRDKEEKDLFRRAEGWRDRIVQEQHRGLKAFFDTVDCENEDLSIVLNEYLGASSDSVRRALRRKIFRLVHAELARRYRTMPSDDTIRQ